MKPATQIPRPRQEADADLVGRLLGIVRGQFCGELTTAQWCKLVPFIRKNVILWSAQFVQGKGFTLPPARFEAILQGVFLGIKRHGQTGEIRYWPGYLMKCVQDHWKHHWEEYYVEAKSVRSIAEMALVNSGRVTQVDCTVEALAKAHQALGGSRRKKSRTVAVKQLNLFGS
jgi:hypothetical protein